MRQRDPNADPTKWAKVRCADLPEVKRSRFRQRQRALELYFAGEISVSNILRKTGISKSELYRLRDRALTVREDGQVWGYLACVPGFHIKEYELSPTTTNGRAGTVTRFFSMHTELFELVSDFALGKKSPDVGIVRGRRFARIWAGFRNACLEKGLDLAYAPSREAIRRLCIRIRKRHFNRSARLEGGKDAADIAIAGANTVPLNRANLPYQRVQLDGHRLDALITIEISDADGTRRDLVLERLWLLVLIDEASRAILGYHIGLDSNYTADDVLDCVAHALEPWAPMETPTPNIAYKPGAGLPSGVILGCEGRAFDSLAFDNAMAHTSAWVQERIIRTVGCEINTGRPARAMSRAIVERFFRTFEQDSLHRWPSTTGSCPSDPRRHMPEIQAERLKISFEDLELAVDMAVANYNASAHKSLNGRSPLDYIRYYDERELTIARYISALCTERLPLYDREFERKIAGNAKLGRRPYVTFMGANYRNETLVNLVNYIGQRITLVVNVKDIRNVQAYLEDGSTIGLLRADEPWLRQPHSLRTRRAILKLIRTGELSRESMNPVGDHLTYIKKRATLTRRARNQLIKQSKEAYMLDPSRDSSNSSGFQSRRGSHRGWVNITRVHSN